MNQKELTKTIMMISNWTKPFNGDVLQFFLQINLAP